jgi:pyruvate formate lyase activating enzyme
MQTGLISHIQKYSLQDGPGIRTTVFLKGCPLRCAWCHNPENISPRPQVMVFTERCIDCGACQTVCPQRRDTGRSGNNHSRSSGCLACGACVEACPAGARTLVGRAMGVQEVVQEILADRIFYDDSHGGVTFSGGEPLAQLEFLRAALVECRRRGVHTAVDTCGFAARDSLLALAPLADLFLYDLKCMDEGRHREFCGVSNGVILENLQSLARTQARIWIRVPVIPGVNDAPDELDALAGFIGRLPAVQQVNLLPYHRIGLHKFERLGQDYCLADLAPPSTERMEAAAAHFQAAGLETKLGG